jgi:hypothetical protein
MKNYVYINDNKGLYFISQVSLRTLYRRYDVKELLTYDKYELSDIVDKLILKKYKLLDKKNIYTYL